MPERPDSFAEGWDVIFSYSRAQAIEDGVLVDVSETAREAGIKYPTVVTRRVWDELVAPNEEQKGWGQDEKGRLWDVLYMFAHKARTSSADLLEYEVLVVKNRIQPDTIKLKAHCGPGDTPEPVITIMFPGED